ncbi:hypothetical protein BDF22DRAFT_778649 [Syncephalis plumigaleata]|nr:hypothetical protein BDF22DRAFT_778649 [Syncephalis plumigaleata]
MPRPNRRRGRSERASTSGTPLDLTEQADQSVANTSASSIPVIDLSTPVRTTRASNNNNQQSATENIATTTASTSASTSNKPWEEVDMAKSREIFASRAKHLRLMAAEATKQLMSHYGQPISNNNEDDDDDDDEDDNGLLALGNNDTTERNDVVEDESVVRQLLARIDQLEQQLANTSKLHQQLHQQMTCSICVEPFNMPHVIQCGHVYCLDCLRHWFNQSKSCPSCRLQLTRRPVPVLLLRNVVDEIFSHTLLNNPEKANEKISSINHRRTNLLASLLKEDDPWRNWFPAETSPTNVILDENDGINICTLGDTDDDLAFSEDRGLDGNDMNNDYFDPHEYDDDYDPHASASATLHTSRYRHSNVGSNAGDEEEEEEDAGNASDASFICSDNYVSFESDTDEERDRNTDNEPTLSELSDDDIEEEEPRLAMALRRKASINNDVSVVIPHSSNHRRRRRQRLLSSDTEDAETSMDISNDMEDTPTDNSNKRKKRRVKKRKKTNGSTRV